MRQFLKSFLLVIALLLTFPLWLPVRMLRLMNRGDQWFLACGQFLSLVPGVTGVFLRRSYYMMALKNCSRDCFISFGTWFSHWQATIGSEVYIGERCSIGMVDIGKQVLIGSNVDILSGKGQHHFDSLDQPIKDQGGRFETVRIGRGSWIGNSTVILSDIGTDSVVGAGSVVVNPIPDYAIAVGNPAKVVKSRKPHNELAGTNAEPMLEHSL